MGGSDSDLWEDVAYEDENYVKLMIRFDGQSVTLKGCYSLQTTYLMMLGAPTYS